MTCFHLEGISWSSKNVRKRMDSGKMIDDDDALL